MRIITENDRRALIPALYCLSRAFCPTRLSQKGAETLIGEALAQGVTLDELFNPGNWRRAAAGYPDGPTPAQCVNFIIRGEDVRPLRDEPSWFSEETGFAIVAEALHDFFSEACGRGGKWSTGSALKNIAKAIEKHGLQALFSEKLVKELTDADPKMTFFGFIAAIVKDFNSIPVDKELTEEQEHRFLYRDDNGPEPAEPGPADEEDAAARAEAEAAEAAARAGEEEDGGAGTYEDPPEDEPFPEFEAGFETEIQMSMQPDEAKRDTIRQVMLGYTPNELMGIVRTIEAGENLPLGAVLDKLVLGQFNPALETPEARSIHDAICADMLPAFQQVAAFHRFPVDKETISNYDLLHDSWDLRSPQVRKLHKLRSLITRCGKEDPDLVDAIDDIEKLYAE